MDNKEPESPRRIPFDDREFKAGPFRQMLDQKFPFMKEMDIFGLAFRSEHERLASRGVASGYPQLDTEALIPAMEMGGIGADATKFLRGDRSWQPAPNTIKVAASVANSTEIMANVTGISFAVEANKTYTFRLSLKVGTTALTCGIFWQFTGPASPTSFWFNVKGWLSGPTAYEEEETAFSTPTSAASQATQLKSTIIEGKLVNGANAGTVQLQFCCEAAAETATVYAGSSGNWSKID